MTAQLFRDLDWLIEKHFSEMMKKILTEVFTWERGFDENLKIAATLSAEQLGEMLSNCWKWRGENDLM